MKSTEKRLGRGLNALIGDSAPREYVKEVEVERISANPYQPRKRFDEDKIEELALSIKENGILQPIIVREHLGKLEIIAGERRFRAAQKAGLARVPVLVKNAEDDKSLELAIIENIQREDLNSIEEAEAFKMLLDKYSYTQEALAKHIGKNRATITNTLRLLKLPEEIKEDIKQSKISSGHARAILALENEPEQLKLAERVIKESLSVREVEKIVKEKKESKKQDSKINEKKKVEIIEIENKLREYLGTKVKIKEGNSKGKIEIEFYSNGDLERLIETIGLSK